MQVMNQKKKKNHLKEMELAEHNYEQTQEPSLKLTMITISGEAVTKL